MGHLAFGNLCRMRGLITYHISPYEQKAFPHVFSKGVPNMIRRCREQFWRVVPPLALGWICYDQSEKLATRMGRKNPELYLCDE